MVFFQSARYMDCGTVLGGFEPLHERTRARMRLPVRRVRCHAQAPVSSYARARTTWLSHNTAGRSGALMCAHTVRGVGPVRTLTCRRGTADVPRRRVGHERLGVVLCHNT
jgi:hypothetical protein